MNRWQVTILAAGACIAATGAAAQGLLPPTAALLTRYDANEDGIVSRAEMEAGLAAEYAAADADHDQCLNNLEMRAENEHRLARDGGQASPLADWNLDGCVNMAEFSSAVRSYFNFVDKSKNDEVDVAELRGPAMPLPIPQPSRNDRNNPPPPDPGTGYSIPGDALNTPGGVYY